MRGIPFTFVQKDHKARQAKDLQSHRLKNPPDESGPGYAPFGQK
jgi:hypothetical protein